MIKNSYNLSLFLLFPLVAKIGETWKDYFSEQDIEALENGYSLDINKPYLDRNVFLSFNWDKMMTFKIKKLIENPFFKLNYSYRFNKKDFRSIYVFDIPEKYKNEYDLIINNMYERLDVKTKIHILSFWEKTADSNLYNELFVGSIEPINILNDIILEEDYIEPVYEELQGIEDEVSLINEEPEFF